MIRINLAEVQFTLSYNEPTVSADGAILHDLKQTNIHIAKNGLSLTSVVVPATNLAGGGIIEQHLILPLTETESVTFVFTVTAEDLSGNISTPNTLTVEIDKVAPAPVQNFTVA
jgi:hypothetical protein